MKHHAENRCGPRRSYAPANSSLQSLTNSLYCHPKSPHLASHSAPLPTKSFSSSLVICEGRSNTSHHNIPRRCQCAKPRRTSCLIKSRSMFFHVSAMGFFAFLAAAPRGSVLETCVPGAAQVDFVLILLPQIRQWETWVNVESSTSLAVVCVEDRAQFHE